MDTKLHSTSSESQFVRIEGYIYISTVIWEMSKMPCKKHLDDSEMNKKFWEEIIRLFSLHKSFIWSTWI
jgi:hypothetical protein